MSRLSQEALEEWYWSSGRSAVLRCIRAVYREYGRLSNSLDTAASHHTDKPGTMVREFISMHIPALKTAVVAARMAVRDEIQRWQDGMIMGRADIIAHYEKILERLEDPSFDFSVIPEGPNWRTEIHPDVWARLRNDIDLYNLRVPTPGPRLTHDNLYEF
jgi:hypothetical protein